MKQINHLQKLKTKLLVILTQIVDLISRYNNNNNKKFLFLNILIIHNIQLINVGNV